MRKARQLKLFSGVAVASLLALAGIASVRAADPVVSQYPSPFDTTGCTALDTSQTNAFSGATLNYLNTEVEPMVAVDPTDSAHVIGVWQQDRWTDGGDNGNASAYSTDGGTTWSNVVPQPFTACYNTIGTNSGGLNYQRASDPWVSIGPGEPSNVSSCAPTTADCSTAYSVSLAFDETDNKNSVAAATSYDGGATWTNVQTIIQDPCVTMRQPGYTCNPKAYTLNDKESVTADPTQPGYAYAVWDRLTAPPASPPGFFHEPAYKGPAWISRTTDYGQTWSAPQQMVTSPSDDQTIGNVIVVDPTTGTLYDFFTYIQNKSHAHGNTAQSIGFVTSTDHGVTWSGIHTVAQEPSVGVIDTVNLDPSTNTAPEVLRTGSGLPEVAVNPNNGQLYVVWEGFDPGSGLDQSFISTSNNGGSSWSTPELVNTDTSESAYTPAVAVKPDGTVGVTYYQWDSAPTTGAEPTELFIQESTTAGSSTTPPTFGGAALLGTEFNGLAAPWALGYFLGDYEGLTANSSGFIPFNVVTHCDDNPSSTGPTCRALTSVVNPTNLQPTGAHATDVVAFPGS
jgi:BNR repeat-like domain